MEATVSYKSAWSYNKKKERKKERKKKKRERM